MCGNMITCGEATHSSVCSSVFGHVATNAASNIGISHVITALRDDIWIRQTSTLNILTTTLHYCLEPAIWDQLVQGVNTQHMALWSM